MKQTAKTQLASALFILWQLDLIGMKVTGNIEWNWLEVLLPSIIVFSLAIAIPVWLFIFDTFKGRESKQ